MRRGMVAAVLLGTIVMVTSADAWALGVRVKRGGGRKNAGNNSGNNQKDDHEQKKRDLHRQHVSQMPASAQVATADTEIFDKKKEHLGLTEEQGRKVDALKEGIRGEKIRLEQEQSIARKSFVEGKEDDCPRLAQAMMKAMRQCSEFDANVRFKEGLAGILSQNQYRSVFPESSN